MPLSIQPLDTSFDVFDELAANQTTSITKKTNKSKFWKLAFIIFVAIVFLAAVAVLLYFFVFCPVICGTTSIRSCIRREDQDVIPTLHQDFGFASYYQTNMVLQREPHRSNIWGYGVVGAIVTISMSGKVYSTTVVTGHGSRGVWSISMDPQPAGTRTDIQAVHDDHGSLQTASISNILFGDVFICGGQSNMRMTLNMVHNSCDELGQTANYPDIRVFSVKPHSSSTPLHDLAIIEQSWTVPSPDDMVGSEDWTYFSGLCWLYGKYLYDELRIPIGLVAVSKGATNIESWSSQTVLEICRESSSSGSQTTQYEIQPYDSALYNAMIHPLFNMTIKGVIWYQGESNALRDPDLYRCMFTNLIKDWRESWHRGSQMSTDPNFPFGLVQIGGVATPYPNYPAIRWHQTADYGYVPNPEMENTFMAVAMDLPDFDSPHGSIHPRYKQDVAFRLTAGALSMIYSKTVVHEGPFPEDIAVIDGNRIIIHYPSTQQLVVADGHHFQICCQGQNCSINDGEEDARWRTTAILEHSDHTVTLDSKLCQNQTKLVDKVRYAWSLNPCNFKQCSVYNTFGFPGAPFILQVNHEIT